ncbi:MAG TPA: lipopolysaccharide kinase InaA family protein [Candidatus Polarisedimenticolia bacterium]
MSPGHVGGAPGPDRAALPVGYLAVRSPRAFWIARSECAEELERGDADLLLAGRGRREKRAGTGRGALMQLDLGGAPAIGKRALHGGLAGPLLGGLYLGSRRIVAQLNAAVRLDERGIPTPDVLAVGWRPALPGLTAQAILTRAIPGALNLYEAVQHDAPWRRRRGILSQAARLVRAMHDAGFLHADLNVTNLVLGGTAEGDRIHVVDLDKGRFVAAPGLSQRAGNLGRLARSHRKWIRGGSRVTPREEIFFMRCYAGSDRALLRALLRELGRG